jgi:hypothetical protein
MSLLVSKKLSSRCKKFKSSYNIKHPLSQDKGGLFSGAISRHTLYLPENFGYRHVLKKIGRCRFDRG